MGFFTRLTRAFGHSWRGLLAAWRSEWAFRVEVFIAPLMALAAFLLPVSSAERALLLLSLFLVLLMELANTAIETLVERISPELHPLSKKAKDIGSALVLLALLNAGAVWGVILLGLLSG